MTATKSKLTPQQQAQINRLPMFANGEYVKSKVSYRDSRILFRALRKLGWHGEYSGGHMLVWKHEETALTNLIRRKYFQLAYQVKYCPHSTSKTVVDYIEWLLHKFDDVLRVWVEDSDGRFQRIH